MKVPYINVPGNPATMVALGPPMPLASASAVVLAGPTVQNECQYGVECTFGVADADESAGNIVLGTALVSVATAVKKAAA